MLMEIPLEGLSAEMSLKVAFFRARPICFVRKAELLLRWPLWCQIVCNIITCLGNLNGMEHHLCWVPLANIGDRGCVKIHLIKALLVQVWQSLSQVSNWPSRAYLCVSSPAQRGMVPPLFHSTKDIFSNASTDFKRTVCVFLSISFLNVCVCASFWWNAKAKSFPGRTDFFLPFVHFLEQNNPTQQTKTASKTLIGCPPTPGKYDYIHFFFWRSGNLRFFICSKKS